MTIYTSLAPSASVTWPEPIEPVWPLRVLSGLDCPPGYKRPGLSLADRLFTTRPTPLGESHLAGGRL